jgi:hypothetical protein
LLVSCGGPAGSGGSGGAVTRNVPFNEVAYVTYGRHDTGTAIVVAASDPSRAMLSRLIDGANVPADRVAVAAFQGEQVSGGFSIRVERIERKGDQLVVHARFSEPAPGSMNTMALTSPVHVVSIASTDAVGLRDAVLIDQTGAQRATATLT